MLKPMSRRKVLGTGLLLFASPLIPNARACEFYASTLRVIHPWTNATPLDAKSAIVCMTIDEVMKADRLIGLETPVAGRAELIRDGVSGPLDLSIPEGSEIVLSEEGTHIRLLDLQQPLLIARAYPLKLIFEKGGIIGTRLTVDYAGKSFGVPFPARRS